MINVTRGKLGKGYEQEPHKEEHLADKSVINYLASLVNVEI